MQRFYFFDTALLPGGWATNVRVRVNDGVIDTLDVGAAFIATDTRLGLVVPGLPNVHSHAFQRAMAGLAERVGPEGTDDFWSWREVMYRFLSKLEADDVQAIAAYTYADMLEAGYTSVGEFHYLHRDSHARLYANPAELALRHCAAAEHTGIGMTLLPVFYEASQFGGAPPTPRQARFITDLDTFADILERVSQALGCAAGHRVGVAPHSLRAVRFESLGPLLQLAPGAPTHIHASEQLKEVTDCLSFTGLRPIEWLLRHCDVDSRWCVVHATHVNEPEIRELARSGAVAGLCPSTEANLGDGIFPAVQYQQESGRWAIGTDSHIALDAAAELRQLEYSQRLIRRSRNTLASSERPSTGRSLLASALTGGAQALGLKVGAIQAGYRADFVALNIEHADLAGRSNDAVLDTWIFSGGRALVHAVIAGGEPVVGSGRHQYRDEIDRSYRRSVKRILEMHH